MFKSVIFASLLTGLAFVTPASASIVFSDDFNSETLALNYSGFANWTVSQGTVDLIGLGLFDLHPGNGRYVDLDGSNGNAGGITTNQTFGPGDYALTFDLGGSARGDAPNTIVVEFDNTQIGMFTLNSSDPLAMQVINFTTATTGALTFRQTNSSDNMGLILDNVSLSTRDTQGVPEPLTLSLLGAGLAAIGLRRRKQK